MQVGLCHCCLVQQGAPDDTLASVLDHYYWHCLSNIFVGEQSKICLCVRSLNVPHVCYMQEGQQDDAAQRA